jgi:hypothetical protein
MHGFKFLVACALCLCTGAMALTGASSLKLQVYSVMLSTSPLCSSPFTVFSNSTPTEVDFLATPTLGGGDPPDATYNCVIIKMLDSIKFKPSTTDGACSAGVEYTDDVCQTAEQTRAPDLVATPTSCTSNVSDIVYLYMSTGKTSVGGGHAFEQPTGPNTNGVPLTSPLVISGTARSKFVVNLTNKVNGSVSPCGIDAPTFNFQKLP